MSWNPDEYGNDALEVLESVEEAEQQEAIEMADAEDVLSAAMQRIEEANLFKLLIKGSVFGEGSASPDILNSVNKKIRLFALQQLEELLGIKQKAAEALPVMQVEIPFDDQQVVALKSLADKVLKRNASPSPISPEDRQPSLNSVKPENKSTLAEPVLNQIQLKSTASAAIQQRKPFIAPKQQVVAAAPKPKPIVKKPRKGRAGGGAGYAMSGKSNLPVPTAEQLIGVMGGTGINYTADSVSGPNGNQIAAGGAGLIQAVVQQLTGGNIVADVSSGDVDQEDINGRF
jgi:hypothetical protein